MQGCWRDHFHRYRKAGRRLVDRLGGRVPGVNAQERTREGLVVSLKAVL